MVKIRVKLAGTCIPKAKGMKRWEANGIGNKKEARKRLAWLSRKGWTRDWAAPAALQASRSYDPTGSKE